MKSLFSGAMLYVKSHMSLLYGYGLIAALITVGGFTASLWLRNAEMKLSIANLKTDLVTTRSTVAQLEYAGSENGRAIGDLKNLRAIDNMAMEGLASDVKQINAKDSKTRQQMQILENQNEAVRKYLDSAIPVDLICLFEPADCPGAQNSAGGKSNPPDPAKGTGGPVRVPK